MIIYIAIYRLAIAAYFAAIRLAALINQKARLFVSGRKDLLHRMEHTLANETRKRIWMHCASLGEFEQGRPVLEAAVYGQPCYYGPIYHQFLEAKELIDARGAFTCKSPDEFAKSILEMEASHAWKQYADSARDYIYSKSGATGIIVDYINKEGLL